MSKFIAFRRSLENFYFFILATKVLKNNEQSITFFVFLSSIINFKKILFLL